MTELFNGSFLHAFPTSLVLLGIDRADLLINTQLQLGAEEPMGRKPFQRFLSLAPHCPETVETVQAPRGRTSPN